MKNLFERTSSNWVRYSEYEWRVTEDGTLYLAPTETAQPSIYDPLAEYQQIALALSISDEWNRRAKKKISDREG